VTPAARRAAARAAVTLVAAAMIVPAASGPAVAADPSCTQQRTAPVYVPETSAALTEMGYHSIWGLATGRGVTVAVIDSGINVKNTHLPAETAVAPGATFVGGIEGWAPDPTGRNDLSGHGTAVASIIAGRPVQGSGQVGLAKDAQLLPMQVFGISEEQRSGDDKFNALLPRTEWLAAGIKTAAERGAKVINVSLSLDRADRALADALTFAGCRGPSWSRAPVTGGPRPTRPTGQDIPPPSPTSCP